MKVNRMMVIVLLAITTYAAQANELSTKCTSLALASEELQQTECSTKNGLTVTRYLGPAPVSVYATEFDRRSVTVANGENAKLVREAAGLTSNSHGMSMAQIRLVKPPVEDQIIHRIPAKATQRYLQWTVWTEEIQYGTQGGAPGFVIDCATALRSNRHGATAVAECFPLEERQRFFHTLKAIK